MIHLNEGFWKSAILLIGSAMTAVGGYFFGNFFTMKEDVALLKTRSDIIEQRVTKDLERVETGIEKLNDKFDAFLNKYQGPSFERQP